MRAIDLQDNLSKAPLAGREQGIQQSSAELGQRHGAQELNRQHAHDQTRTKASEETEGPDNRVDDHDDGRGQYQGQHGSRREPDDQQEPVERPRPSETSREIDLMA